MTIEHSNTTDRQIERAEASAERPDIKPQEWAGFNSGAKVLGPDGAEIGTVRETLPGHLIVRAKENIFSEVELYVPRELIEDADREHVRLRHTGDELKAMNLTTPPAMQ